MKHYLALFLLLPLGVFSQTIEEKKEELAQNKATALREPLKATNQRLFDLRSELEHVAAEVRDSFEKGEGEGAYKSLLKRVNFLRKEIASAEKSWREKAVESNQSNEEACGLWDQEEATLSQLIMEYGAPDYLYVIPPEIGSMKLHMHSEVPIPRQSWSELLEILLAQNGVGIKEINPFTRQLYMLKQDLIAVDSVVSHKSRLEFFPEHKRVIYVLSCDPERSKAVAQFFERFRDPKMSTVYQAGSKIALISQVSEVKKLLTLYETVWNSSDRKVSKVFSLTKLPAKEMERILKAFFEDSKKRITLTRGLQEELTVMTLQGESALAVVGPQEMVDRADAIVRETEEQISDPAEMTVYWYTCKHSDPIEVSSMLEKVYLSLIGSPIEEKGTKPSEAKAKREKAEQKTAYPTYGTPASPPVVSPPPFTPTTAAAQKQTSETTNFIPYPQTGAIMMVVRKDLLKDIQELVRKMDIPKKMVQVEVLLVEKKITNQNNFGLNLLRIGADAKHVRETGVNFDSAKTQGILEFFISRPSFRNFPAFDLAYNFLMSQNDVRINASPSILTLNQTPAQFSNVEEISINSGAAPIQTNKSVTFENSFVRAQFGINIVITPTIHEAEIVDGEPQRYLTMETNLSFDTTKSNKNDRPDVNRRGVVSHVRVLDKETIVLGGLQRKISEDSTDKIPFLGELPGVGKFFGTSELTDKYTDMFLFITPHIIDDDDRDMKAYRYDLLMRRPGDVPEFYERIQAAKEAKKRKLFTNSIRLLFGTANG